MNSRLLASSRPTRRQVLESAALGSAAAAVAPYVKGAYAAGSSSPPINIVFILVDNAGWGDLSVYGGVTPTPRIDGLASQGIRFNNYNVEPQCTPTRSAILTGRMPVRQGTYTVPLPGQGAYGLSPWEYTLAHLLSDAGYSTALFGKWHCGEAPGRLPTDVGFDEWWGLKNSSDEAGYTAYPLFKEAGIEPPMIWEGKKGQQSTPVMPLDMNLRPIINEKYIIPKIISFIKAQAEAKKPFFVYVGYSEMHPPMAANPNFAGKSTARGGVYADVIAELDYRVGQVLDAIKDAGIDENTIVVLTADNTTGGGPAVPGGYNGPWRGNFMTPPFEGSYRFWHGQMAGSRSSRRRHERDAECGRLVRDASVDRGRGESHSERSTDRQYRFVALPAGREQHDRKRYVHAVRTRRSTDVDKMEILQGHLSLC
jgi:arylsulfatase